MIESCIIPFRLDRPHALIMLAILFQFLWLGPPDGAISAAAHGIPKAERHCTQRAPGVPVPVPSGPWRDMGSKIWVLVRLFGVCHTRQGRTSERHSPSFLKLMMNGP